MIDREMAGGHVIETDVIVHLYFDCNSRKWKVDPVTVDGYPLDQAFQHSPVNGECGCSNKIECQRIAYEAWKTAHPTGGELITLLGEAIVARASGKG